MTGDHWNANRSRFRTGEPEDHFKAKNHIAKLIQDVGGFDVHKEYPLVDPMYRNLHYKHNYDVVAFGEMIIVEIDDPDLHSKPKKVRNDRIAMNRAYDQFPNSMHFFRLDRDEINAVTRDEYIKENLFEPLTEQFMRGFANK